MSTMRVISALCEAGNLVNTEIHLLTKSHESRVDKIMVDRMILLNTKVHKAFLRALEILNDLIAVSKTTGLQGEDASEMAQSVQDLIITRE